LIEDTACEFAASATHGLCSQGSMIALVPVLSREQELSKCFGLDMN
jgi:hypothetical protein